MMIACCVIQAGEKNFHPSCAFCCKCGLSFGEGEDMCVSGNDIWHLDCDRAEAAALRPGNLDSFVLVNIKQHPTVKSHC